jgi:hypothetical protein
VMWEPPSDDEGDLADAVGRRLTELGARPWQVDLTRDLLVDAIGAPVAVVEAVATELPELLEEPQESDDADAADDADEPEDPADAED